MFRLFKKTTDGLTHLLHFPLVSLVCLFLPACIAVTQANALADFLYDTIQLFLKQFLVLIETLPAPLAAVLGGNYGIVAMLPFLLLYALPTILIFAALIAFYKQSGLINHLSYGLHKFLKYFGLSGQDLVRVIMGYGCNVPAVLATRSCSSASRCSCISAIAHGSICSYQLSSSLAIFAATGLTVLAPIYVALVGVNTLIYLKLIRPKNYQDTLSKIESPKPEVLKAPKLKMIISETNNTLKEFIVMALPIFVGICIISGLFQYFGILASMSQLLSPLMALFNLPPEAALSVVLGSVRKDGIAVGLLDADLNSLKILIETPVQLLTIVYLAGVLLPCIVTIFTVIKEMRFKFAFKMVTQQASFAIICSLVIAWAGAMLN